ncbi:MAG: hypothetical protein NC548_34610, partial [Lachnospiraceae bacterium]|nr:hypothetical protein [Lachnospiraceae bacterium]
LYSCNDKKSISSSERRTHYATLSNNVYNNGMLYFESDKDIISYLDFKTMESTVMCSKPNCNHKNNECIGKSIGDCPIIYDNYIYFFKSSQQIEEIGNGERELKINSKLCRASIDTSAIEDIVEFYDCVPRDYDGWLINDNIVWFTADDMNPVSDEYGNITYGNQGGTHFICSIDIDKKEYKNYGSVYDGDKEYEAASYSSSAQIKGIYDSKIMIRYEYAKKEPSFENSTLQQGEVFNHRSILEELMFEFDIANKELLPVSLVEPAYVDEDTYVYTDSGTSYVITNGNNYEFKCDEMLSLLFINGKLFDYLHGKWFDTVDKTEHSMGEYSDWTVYAYYDECYIIGKNNKEFRKLTEQELYSLSDVE